MLTKLSSLDLLSNLSSIKFLTSFCDGVQKGHPVDKSLNRVNRGLNIENRDLNIANRGLSTSHRVPLKGNRGLNTVNRCHSICHRGCYKGYSGNKKIAYKGLITGIKVTRLAKGVLKKENWGDKRIHRLFKP